MRCRVSLLMPRTGHTARRPSYVACSNLLSAVQALKRGRTQRTASARASTLQEKSPILTAAMWPHGLTNRKRSSPFDYPVELTTSVKTHHTNANTFDWIADCADPR